MASTRLPNKPLADIAGLPMVVRVAQRIRSGVSPATRIVVAADHESIIQTCELNGLECILTREDHASGSDRLAEACELLALSDTEVVVNVQGDEPLIDPGLVESVANLLQRNQDASMGTAAHAIKSLEDFTNPNVVKVVTGDQGYAIYFSRAPLPWPRDHFASSLNGLPSPAPLRHIGIYSYRVGFLKKFPRLTRPSMEIAESLEQLRAIWHGYRIAVHVTENAPGAGVDTPEDLERVRRFFEGKPRETVS
jgi:3-deoxy-manno-octulosonate cytidylyltransferase (CMP-KDO synthetase)